MCATLASTTIHDKFDFLKCYSIYFYVKICITKLMVLVAFIKNTCILDCVLLRLIKSIVVFVENVIVAIDIVFLVNGKIRQIQKLDRVTKFCLNFLYIQRQINN